MGTMLASGAAWRAAAMFAVSLAIAGLSVPAEAGDVSGRWRVGLDGGFALLDTAPFPGSDTTPVLLAFHAHYRLHDRLQVGGLLGGYLTESANRQDPVQGNGISQAMLLAELRPLAASPATWIEAGAGSSQWWSNAPGDSNDSGFAWQLALGHDAWPGRVSQTPGLHAAPFIAIGAGDGGHVSHEAFAVGVRFDWRL